MKYSDIKHIEKMKLIGDRILVIKDKPQEKSEGGLYLPGEVSNDPIAKVVSTGPEVKIDAISGDYVLYVAYAGQAFKIDDREYIVLQENEVVGIIS